ncbi:MAG: hypothetical protein LBK95_17510 [Bifidobacteriaceae bacterium]|nr:hypothetical protein [Bifidobacteriaceae bacterium]
MNSSRPLICFLHVVETADLHVSRNTHNALTSEDAKPVGRKTADSMKRGTQNSGLDEIGQANQRSRRRRARRTAASMNNGARIDGLGVGALGRAPGHDPGSDMGRPAPRGWAQ